MSGWWTLLRGEFRHNLFSWLALLVGMAACGVGCALCFAMMATGAGDAQSSVGDAGGTALSMAIMSTVSVAASLSGLICRERQPQVAIWKLAGMAPWSLLLLVLGQVLVVSTIGALLGALVAIPLAPGFLAPFGVLGMNVDAGRITTADVVRVVQICAIAAAAGAAGSTIRLARLRPMKVLGQSAAPQARLTVVGVLWAGLMLATWGWLLATPASHFDHNLSGASKALALQLLLLVGVLPLMPVVFRILMQWTRILDALGAIPRVAARNLRHRSAFTVALEMPWFLGLATIVGLGGVLMAILHRVGGTADHLDLMVRLMLPALTPAAVGGLASLLILRPRSISDGVGLRLAGASAAQRLAQLLTETGATVFTVGLATLGYTVVGVAVTNHEVTGTWFPAGWIDDLLLPQLGGLLGGMTVVVALVQLATSRSAAVREH